jgi:hypothetical protein
MAVYFLSSANPSVIITGTAENSGENVVFTPNNTMVPENILASDWEWAVFTYSGAMLVDFTSPGATDRSPDAGTNLARGTPITLGAAGVDLGTTGDVLKIRYKKSEVYQITII